MLLATESSRTLKKREGYAFPLVLAAIIVISLVTVLAADQVRDANSRLADLADRTRIDREFHSAEQTFLYLALTSPASDEGVEVGAIRDGIGELTGVSPEADRPSLLPANGTPMIYGDGDVVLRYVDAQGFISLALSESIMREARYDALGLPRTQHMSIQARLVDYQDEDDLRQLGGAEADDYARRDRHGFPPNRFITAALEVCAPLEFDALEICQDEGWLLLLTEPRETAHLNVDLATPFLVSHLETIAEATGRAGWQGERSTVLADFAALGWPEFDVIEDILHMPSPPHGQFVLISHDPEARFARRTSFLLTPGTEIAPYVIRSRYRIGGEFVRHALETDPDETDRRLFEPG